MWWRDFLDFGDTYLGHVHPLKTLTLIHTICPQCHFACLNPAIRATRHEIRAKRPNTGNTADSSKTFHYGHLKMTLAKESRTRALLNKKGKFLYCPCRAQTLGSSADRWSTLHNICSPLSFQWLERLYTCFKSIPNTNTRCFCSQNTPSQGICFSPFHLHTYHWFAVLLSLHFVPNFLFKVV